MKTKILTTVALCLCSVKRNVFRTCEKGRRSCSETDIVGEVRELRSV
jgi:hypothetical protein